jgi:hypothetical protein
VIDEHRDRRVGWFINHTALRTSEVPLLRSLGLEVLTSKHLPYRQHQTSSVDYSHDGSLTIPREVLDRLNRHNFYEEDFPQDIVDHLNTHFGTLICAWYGNLIDEVLRKYKGRIVLRTFGLQAPDSYSDGLVASSGARVWDRVWQIRERFWFAQAYDGIVDIERSLLRQRAITLPVSLPPAITAYADTWTGTDRRILFVCPRIGDKTGYYGRIYKTFKKRLGDLPHLIAGSQLTRVRDNAVTGWAPEEQYRKWFSELRVMFYHSREPRHLHYHPLEAITSGMPVIFMRGGLLDGLGGADQPGACSNFREAKRKLRSTLDGDTSFAQKCIDAQRRILEKFSREHSETQWRETFMGQVLGTPLKEQTPVESVQIRERSRPSVAVFLPKPYRGGTLQVVKRLASALKLGARKKNVDLNVVVSYLEGVYDADSEFKDLRQRGIATRATTWRTVFQKEAHAIIDMQGLKGKKGKEYVLPGDGCNDFLDCGFWLIVSDRIGRPILPVRPYGVYELDFIQRYVPETFPEVTFEIQKVSILPLLRNAEFVIATTRALAEDIKSYGAIPSQRILKSPLLIECPREPTPEGPIAEGYFVWPTNTTRHKNHLRVLGALRKYYEETGGKLKTLIIGPTSEGFRPGNQDRKWDMLPHVPEAQKLIAKTMSLSENLVIAGELSDAGYSSAISHARFLLTPNLYDNGSFTTIDVAEICRLSPKWFDPYSVDDLTRALVEMESEADSIELPQREFLETLTWENRSEEIFESIYPHILRCSVHALR